MSIGFCHVAGKVGRGRFKPLSESDTDVLQGFYNHDI